MVPVREDAWRELFAAVTAAFDRDYVTVGEIVRDSEDPRALTLAAVAMLAQVIEVEEGASARMAWAATAMNFEEAMIDG